MRRLHLPALPSVIVAFILAAPLFTRQTSSLVSPAPSAVAALPQLDYPDSTSGLQHLVKDIVKAQRENDPARADLLLKSLVLPDPRRWYDQVFGETVAEEPEALYEKSTASIPPSLAGFFLNAEAQNLDEVRVVRYEKSCDDNAGEDTFGVLHARVQPVPLYELRLMRGDVFIRLFAFAFVDGAFRFIYIPRMEGRVFGGPRLSDSTSRDSKSVAPQTISQLRIQVGSSVQAARLIHRVPPEYPEVARREHLQGSVRLRALIAKDGSFRKLYVIKGYCSLAEASLAAVRQWRYSPTLINGDPVEVDTEIVVTFQLSR